jgi:hypothetical protein
MGTGDLKNPVIAEYKVISNIRHTYRLKIKIPEQKPSKEGQEGEEEAAPIKVIPAVLEPDQADAMQFSYSSDLKSLTVYLMKNNAPYKKMVLERYLP